MILFLGNTWGICANGTGAMGCGDQEMFRNCADIKIISNVQHPPNIQLPRVPAPNAIFVSNDLEEEAAENRAQLVVRSQVCVPVPIHSNR